MKKITQNRHEQLTEIYRFIDTACIEECALIIAVIRCCHDNVMAFNPDTKLLAKIESVSINGDCIQLNIE